MSAETSIGPEEPAPTRDVKTQATTEGVDAQNASQIEMEHQATEPATKPISEKPAGGQSPGNAQDDQKHPNNPSRYEAGQQIREIDMPEKPPKPGKGGLADNGE
jgi:hypothetical protein